MASSLHLRPKTGRAQGARGPGAERDGGLVDTMSVTTQVQMRNRDRMNTGFWDDFDEELLDQIMKNFCFKILMNIVPRSSDFFKKCFRVDNHGLQPFSE